ncbi:hypothetical protein E4U13_004620 [Claviceps humidiphila]|uniref:Uncharacterized protein n=2 Tax=Claviceps TaxID=5110 RepID=A0A9P7PYC9_9HYPO|nr:hypothetical protein E4U57_003644 [Claviceps arundinis]KAG6111770.1 hypothetical protein E4U13_004620 [Claviceps humidiphila]
MCAEQIKKDTKRPRVDGVRGSDQSRGDEGSNETEDGEAKTRTGQDRGLSLDEASGCPAIRRAGLTGACDVSGLPSTYPSMYTARWAKSRSRPPNAAGGCPDFRARHGTEWTRLTMTDDASSACHKLSTRHKMATLARRPRDDTVFLGAGSETILNGYLRGKQGAGG